MRKRMSIIMLLCLLVSVISIPNVVKATGGNNGITPTMKNDYLNLANNITTKYGFSDRQTNDDHYAFYLDESQKGLQGLEYAKLIDFNNDGIKELLFVYNPTGSPVNILIEVWGHNGTKPHLVFSNGNSADGYGDYGRYPFQDTGGNAGEIGITEVDNHIYFYFKQLQGTGAELGVITEYYTITNGKWELKEDFYTIEYYDEGYPLPAFTPHYYRNDKKVTEMEFQQTLSKFENNSKAIVTDFADDKKVDEFNYKEFTQLLKNPIEPSLYLDSNTKIKTNPIIVDGRTLVPLRALLEEMGAKIEWNGNTKTVKAIKDNTTIIMKIDSKDATVNGKNVKLDVPAKLINGSTFVPARFVGESFNYEVKWIEKTKTILINSY